MVAINSLHAFISLLFLDTFLLTDAFSLMNVGTSFREPHQGFESRRRLLISLPFISLVQPVAADDGNSSGVLLQTTVTLTKNADISEISGEKSAIYITARPNTPDNVPKAILDGSRGKPPPVLIARIPGVTAFPLEYSFTQKDVTVEGAAAGDGSYWWQGAPLVVSARLDSDGVAATRDPTDLVGRGVAAAGSRVEVELQGRGVAGKLFTSK